MFFKDKKILKVTGFTSFAQILKKNYRNVDNVNANIKNKKYTSGFILSKLKNNTEISIHYIDLSVIFISFTINLNQ